mgnify:FL=1
MLHDVCHYTHKSFLQQECNNLPLTTALPSHGCPIVISDMQQTSKTQFIDALTLTLDLDTFQRGERERESK